MKPIKSSGGKDGPLTIGSLPLQWHVEMGVNAEWGRITAVQLIRPMQGKLIRGDQHIGFTGISTDSRKVKPGEFFWALEGERYDGHDFVEAAVKAGASGVVICEKALPRFLEGLESGGKGPGPVIVTVGDTLQALGDLAHWWRVQHDVFVIAITGSAGKTTTKEMCALILERSASVLKTHGNFNNLIGVPLTLLRLVPGVSKAVVELGMNRPGEIRRLTEISDPDVGVITNVGKAHLEGLGCVENVARAKVELIEKMSPDAGMVLNGDDRLLMATAGKVRQDAFTFGLGAHNRVYAEDLQEKGMNGISFRLRHRDGSWPVNLKVPGRHNVQNALGAAAIGFLSGCSPEHILAGLEEFQGIKSRLTIERLSCGITVIDDSYNANPASLQAALNTGKSMIPKRGRFLVALGDMLELGNAAHKEHRAAGRLVADAGAAYFVALGDYASEMIKGAIDAGLPEKSVVMVGSRDEMAKRLAHIAEKGDLIFIKGSRMMELEKVVQRLKRDIRSA